MWQILLGIVIALVIMAPAAFVCLRKMAAAARNNKNSCSDRLQELSRLTGGLAHEIKNPLSTIKVNLKLVNEDFEGADKTDQEPSKN